MMSVRQPSAGYYGAAEILHDLESSVSVFESPDDWGAMLPEHALEDALDSLAWNGGVTPANLERVRLYAVKHDLDEQEAGALAKRVDTVCAGVAAIRRTEQAEMDERYQQAQAQAEAWDREHPQPKYRKCTETGNAERLLDMYGQNVRYSPERKSWLIWGGSRWSWDKAGEIQQYAKATVRSIYAEAAACLDDKKRLAIDAHARRSEKMASRSAMVRAAETEPDVPILLSQLDANPWVLNCENGTINLRTGILHRHDRDDLLTKSTGLNFDPDARSEVWDRIVRDATGGDAELATFIQRVAGYALIGIPLERAFFFLFGPPGTAKSTLILALEQALGEYCQSADFETWLHRSNIGGNRGDLVRLAGCRLVTSCEVRHGAKWDEALLKRVTGDDKLTAAAKFENEVTFQPTFTLLMAGNDAPSARDDDAGLWARMRRIPLTAQIPKHRQDPTIKAKLREPEHAAAVLAWAVAGCLAYQRFGFGISKAVEESTSAYRAENDHFGEFLADRLILDEYGAITRRVLTEQYEAWCAETGRKVLLSPKEVAKRLRERGCEEGKAKGARYWTGLRVRNDADEQSEGAAGQQGAAGGTSPREVADYSFS